MKLVLDADEAWTLLSLIVHRLSEEAGLSDEDRARLKIWRSEEMKVGSEAMQVFAEKLNADLERAIRSKEKSAIRRPDWI